MKRAMLLLALTACPGHGGDDAGPDRPCAMVVEWGLRTNGAFVPLGDGDLAPITLGFQGFRFIAGGARIRGSAADTAIFHFDALIDGHEATSQDVGRIDLSPAADGAVEGDGLQLFFNDVPLASLLGRSATVTLTAKADACAASYTARVALVRGCDQLSDGGITCDGGP